MEPTPGPYSTPTAWRRVAAVAIFLFLAIGAFEPFYWKIFFLNGPRLAASFVEMPFRKLPGYRLFLEGLDRRTPPRARIALVLPYRTWGGGYGYAFNSASYLLPGRQLVPLLALNEDRVELSNLRGADYIASFDQRIAVPGFEAAWEEDKGMLLKRTAPSTARSSASRER